MRLAVFVAILFLCNDLSAQLNGKYTFRHIDKSNGLLNTTVSSIVQDERGFMWVLTPNGLQRYDGHRFVNYPEVMNQAAKLNPEGTTLSIDTLKHQIEIVKWDRMVRLDLTNNMVSTITTKDLLKEENPPPVLYQAKNDEKWLIGERGMVIYKKDKVDSFSLISSNRDWQTYFNRDQITGNYWVLTYSDLGLAEPNSSVLQFYSDENPTHPLFKQMKKVCKPTLNSRFAVIDSYRNLWFVPWENYILRYDIATEELFYYSLKEIKARQNPDGLGEQTLLVNTIFEDRQKNIWLATDNLGLLLFNRDKNDFEYITSDDRISNGLKYSFRIQTVYQDRSDNLWLGTDRGISIFNPYRNQFQTIRHIDGNRASLPKFDIDDFIETSQGEILVATWGGGITIYDLDWNFKRNVEFEGPSPVNMVWSFVQNEDGTIWAGTQKGYIHIYDPVKKTFKTIHPEETNNSTIRTMTKDRHGNLYLGLHNGKVVVWKKKDKKFYPFIHTPGERTPGIWPIMDIYIDESNRCWTSHELGTIREFDADKQTFKGFYPIRSAFDSAGIIVYGLTSYNDSILLAGTLYYGIQAFNKNTLQFSSFLEDQIPLNSTVHAIRKDQQGNLWFTTNFDLYFVNPKQEVIQYNLDNAILTNTLQHSRFVELSDGRWLTSSFSEIISFYPDEMSHGHASDLKVQISSFKVNNKEIYIDSFLAKQLPVTLPYDQNFFSIEFSTLHFMDMQHSNYYYRLSNVDKDWIYSDTRRYADYTDIKPGEYVFEVRANNGSTFSKTTSIPIIIKPPWWGTLWFRGILLFAVGSMVYLGYKKRIRTIRKEVELKHSIAEAEMMALRSQMNPHFIFNCINGIDAMIQSNDKYRATLYLNKFAKLIRNVLESSKQNKVPLSRDIETLQLYLDLELFRHQDKFTAEIRVEDDLLLGDYAVPPLIIQPYVENAILHGLRHKTDHQGKLLVTVQKEENHLLFMIEDNGVGRKMKNGSATKSSNGYGMQMSHDRIRLHNEEELASVQITDLERDGAPTGTRVQIKLKIE